MTPKQVSMRVLEAYLRAGNTIIDGARGY